MVTFEKADRKRKRKAFFLAIVIHLALLSLLIYSTNEDAISWLPDSLIEQFYGGSDNAQNLP